MNAGEVGASLAEEVAAANDGAVTAGNAEDTADASTGESVE